MQPALFNGMYVVLGRTSSKPRLVRREGAARDALVAQWQYLPAWCFSALLKGRYAEALRAIGTDDCISIGRGALIRAAEIWDDSRNVKFNSYAITAIMRRLVAETCRCNIITIPHNVGPKYASEAEQARQPGSSLSELFYHGADDLPGPESDPKDEVERDESVQFKQHLLERLMKGLEPRLRTIVVQRIVHGRTLQDIANKLKITKERVRQLQRDAMEQLQSLATKCRPEEVARALDA